MHYKNRKPKGYKGHCWMCADWRGRHGGLRNKRRKIRQEERFKRSADEQERERF